MWMHVSGAVIGGAPSDTDALLSWMKNAFTQNRAGIELVPGTYVAVLASALDFQQVVASLDALVAAFAQQGVTARVVATQVFQADVCQAQPALTSAERQTLGIP